MLKGLKMIIPEPTNTNYIKMRIYYLSGERLDHICTSWENLWNTLCMMGLTPDIVFPQLEGKGYVNDSFMLGKDLFFYKGGIITKIEIDESIIFSNEPDKFE